MKVELTEVQLKNMLFWQGVYAEEVQRVLNIINSWDRSWRRYAQ